MIDCNKCIFSKCCKDANRKLKKCEYYEENTAWIKDYLIRKNLWKDEYYDKDYTNDFNYTDDFLGHVLDLQQKENVKAAKDELILTFAVIGLVILFITTVIALLCGNAYKWSMIYLQFLICVGSSILLFWIVKGLWLFLRFVFTRFRTIIRGR